MAIKRCLTRIGAGFGLLVVLAGCLPTGPVEQVRDPSVTLSATSRFDANAFQGRWVGREVLGSKYNWLAFDFAAPKGGKPGFWREVVQLQPNSTRLTRQDARIALDGTGLFTLTYDGRRGYQQQLVVLWVDEGFRTAVIATREGDFAMILDRKLSGGEDRIKAARSLLAHNGFDVSKLRLVIP